MNGVCKWIEPTLLIRVNYSANFLTSKLDLQQRTISKQVHILLCPINHSCPLPLMGGGLERRLKHLSTLTKVSFEKYKPTLSANMEVTIPSRKLEWFKHSL